MPPQSPCRRKPPRHLLGRASIGAKAPPSRYTARMDFELTTEEQALRQRARDLADRAFAERAARWDASEEYPWDNVKDLATAGFMGMTVPTAYGGGERPLLDVILVIEEIARACGITGRIVVEGNLGTVGALDAYGTDAQKRRWVSWGASGGE